MAKSQAAGGTSNGKVSRRKQQKSRQPARKGKVLGKRKTRKAKGSESSEVHAPEGGGRVSDLSDPGASHQEVEGRKGYSEDESAKRFLRITYFIEELKTLSLQGLREKYEELWGKAPPPTNSKNWLFHNCSYRFQYDNYWDEEVSAAVGQRMLWWQDRPTPEQELMEKFQAFTDKKLEELCEEYGLVWKKTKRKELLKKLTEAVAGVEEIYGVNAGRTRAESRNVNSPESGGKKVRRGGGNRSPRVRQDSLPDTIEELLELKRSADKDMQRRIRRKLRSIDPNWTKKGA